ncbi:MAG: aminotransferase class V-fold PLP-dependent enzyme [Chloroflexota bacterium]|nr:aminotransferase class V-fold PLP-dependent enzyme [Chloroflexota bacterium]
MTTAAIRALFKPEPESIYLDTATYGLLPSPTVAAMQRALLRWQAGSADFIAEWERAGDESRALFARLIGAGEDEIALVPTVSVGVGPMVASLAPGDEVVVPDAEFTSVLFPLLVAAESRGVIVRQVPFAGVAGAITGRTRLAAFSLVQSQGGRAADLAGICQAARQHGARVLVDATHAIPFYPVAGFLPAIDVLVCHGYKHLLCPRGAGFLYVRRDVQDALPPVHANWRSVATFDAGSYGGPLALAPDARRFDVSLDWLAWVGARQSLALLLEWQAAGALTAAHQLARELARQLGEPPPGASVVSCPVADAETVLTMLGRAGIRAGAPAGRIRLAPHVYNTAAEIDRVVSLLEPFVVGENRA